MKYKIVLCLFLGFFCLSLVKVSKKVPTIDITNMVLVERGTFFMGIDSVQLEADIKRFNKPLSYFSQEYPALRVTTPPFYMDKYEVTNADYKKFIEANPFWSKAYLPDSLQDGNYLKDWKGNKYPKGKADCPVTYVCWYAANAYARWHGKRLPTESEMEHAAKGLDLTSMYPWGNANADSTKVNYLQSHTGHAVRGGSYPPNNLGLYDMSGNVWEFCADRWRLNLYANLNKRTHGFNNLFPPVDNNKVTIRGGSWNSPAVDIRTTHRDGFPATGCNAEVGFRCAATFK